MNIFSVGLPISLPLSLIPQGRICDKMKSGLMKMGQQTDTLLSPLKVINFRFCFQENPEYVMITIVF